MTDIFTYLTLYLQQYGLWLLAACIMLQNHGLPSGASIMVVASGVLLAAGNLDPVTLSLVVLLANLIGDFTCYALWKRLGEKIFQRFPGLKLRLDNKMAKTRDAFERSGFLAVLLTRFPLSVLGPVMNIVAGTAQCSLAAFAPAVVAGEVVWTAFYIGLGYWFKDSWESVYGLLSQGTMWFLIGAAVVLVFCLFLKQIKKVHPAQLY